MEKEEVFRLIDGFLATYSSQANGITDAVAKERLKNWLHGQFDEEDTRIYPRILDEFVIELLADKSYGLEDIKTFLNWLEDEMEMI